jgi:hypothetical protein
MSRGGARKGAGRKAGQKSEKTLQREAATRAVVEQAVGELPEAFEGDSYAFLALVYKDMRLPFGLRTAKTAIAYERPRLANVAMTTRSLDQLSDEEFFRAWDDVTTFLAQHGRPRLLEMSAGSLDEEPASPDAAGRDTAGRDDVG